MVYGLPCQWLWYNSDDGETKQTSLWRMFSITMPTVRVLRNGSERSQAV